VRTGGGISKPECGAFDRRRRGSGSVMSVRTDGLGGVPCAGSRGAAKDRPGGQRFCGHTPVATLWVGWTLKLSFEGSGRYFFLKKKKIQGVFLSTNTNPMDTFRSPPTITSQLSLESPH